MTSILVHYMRSTHKEKIIRICLSMIRNLLTKAGRFVMPILIGNKFLFILETVSSKGYMDVEINHDADFLKGEIEKALESLRFNLVSHSLLVPLMSMHQSYFLANSSGP